MDTMELVKQYSDEMIQIRRHIHEHPELSNEEFKTTELIKEKLTESFVERIPERPSPSARISTRSPCRS